MAPVVEATTPVVRERLFHCEHFRLWRLRGESPFTVGAAGVPRVLVCIDGDGAGGARRRHLCRRKRRRVALAGGGRSVYFSAARAQ